MTRDDLVRGFYKAKTKGSPWCYLSKIRDALGVKDSEMESLIRNIKLGIIPRDANGYKIAFELDPVSNRKRYDGVNFVSVYPSWY